MKIIKKKIQIQKYCYSNWIRGSFVARLRNRRKKYNFFDGCFVSNKVPKKLAIIGGGYIGLEMGSVWSRLGSEVTVIEYLDYITPGMDREVSSEFKKFLQNKA